MLIASPHVSARLCLAPGEEAPWRWDESGEVVVWEDYTTIVFVNELTQLASAIGGRPTPVFGAVVMILAACRGLHSSSMQWLSESMEGAPSRPVRVFNLDAIAALPKDLRTGMASRAELICMLAEGMSPVLPPHELAARLAEWRNGAASDVPLPPVDSGESENALASPAQAGRRWVVCPALGEFSEEKLRLRLRTGLTALPDPPQLPPPAGEAPEGEPAAPLPLRDLIREMESDQQYAGLTKVMRGVMAALTLPRRLSRPDDIPAGGVSDVASRGSPERLLITELAADPEVLAVRLVMGEALYLRREPPAVKRDPPPLVFMDASLRLWGLPRVFAAACSFAILAARGSDQPGRIFVANGEGVRSVVLAQREAVAALLECLDPALDPMPAVRRWLKEVEGEPAESERCLVTHAVTARQGWFRQALREFPSMLVATVDRDGSFVLTRHSRGGGSQVCALATIALDGLFAAAPQVAAVLSAGGSTARRPVWHSLKERPLLTSPRGPVMWALPVSDESGVAVMDSGQVVCWTHEKSGSRVIFSAPEARAAYLFHRIEPGRFALFLPGERGRRDFVRIAILGTGTPPLERVLHAGPLPAWTSVTADERVAYFLGERKVTALSLATGDVLGSADWKLDGKAVTGPHGFVSVPAGPRQVRIFRLMWTGTNVELTPADGCEEAPESWLWMEEHSRMLTFGQRDGLRLNGEVVSEDRNDWPLTHLVNCLTAGNPMVAGPLGASLQIGRSGEKIHFGTGIRNVSGRERPALTMLRVTNAVTPEMFRRTGVLTPPSVPLTLHVNAAAFSPDGLFGLRAQRSGTWRWLVLNSQPVWRRGPAPAADDPGIRKFSRVTMNDEEGEFMAADWPHLRVWFDPDGLVHLVSSDPSVPELALTLSDPSMAWWLSDGTAGGREFYLPAGASPHAAERLANALRRMAEISQRT